MKHPPLRRNVKSVREVLHLCMNICSKGKRSENIIIVAIELESLLQQMYTEQM